MENTTQLNWKQSRARRQWLVCAQIIAHRAQMCRMQITNNTGFAAPVCVCVCVIMIICATI